MRTTLSQHIIQLERQAQACHWSTTELEASLSQASVHVLTHWQQEQLVAYLLAQKQVDTIEIWQLTVLPSHRRQGIASALLRQLFVFAQSHAIQRILLDVRASNEAAIALYQQIGFVIDGRRRQYYAMQDGQREDALLMSIML